MPAKLYVKLYAGSHVSQFINWCSLEYTFSREKILYLHPQNIDNKNNKKQNNAKIKN